MKYLHYSVSRITLISAVIVIACFTNSSAVTKVVNVANFSFTPSSFSMNLGDTVKFVWVGGSHTTSSTSVPVGATTWDHPINSTVGNTSFIYVPAVTGTYNYRCNIHPTSMIGSFTVSACNPPTAAQAAITAGEPTTFCKPASVTLTVATGGLTYQWKKGNNPLNGMTNQSYVAKGTGSYKCDVSNACGTTTSNTISVTANPQPAATITPSGIVNKCANDHVTLTANSGMNLTYQWKKGSANIAGATNNTLDVVMAAKYKVVVTNSVTGCSKTSAATTVNNVCKTTEVGSLNVFPNPSTTDFSFGTALLNANGTVEIYDLTGQLLESIAFDHNDVIAGKNLSEGIYLAKVEVAGQPTAMFKLIKNH